MRWSKFKFNTEKPETETGKPETETGNGKHTETGKPETGDVREVPTEYLS